MRPRWSPARLSARRPFKRACGRSPTRRPWKGCSRCRPPPSGGEAILERLLYPTPDDFAKHGCTFSPGPKQPGIFKATTVCPPIDQTPGVTAEAEISYKPDSYEGLGQLTVKDKAGTTVKGSSVLSGKRVGDC